MEKEQITGTYLKVGRCSMRYIRLVFQHNTLRLYKNEAQPNRLEMMGVGNNQCSNPLGENSPVVGSNSINRKGSLIDKDEGPEITNHL